MRGGAAAVLAAAALAGCSGGSPQAVESGAPGGGPSAAVGDTGGAGNSGGLPQAQVEIESPVELPFAAYFEAGNQITETLARRGHSAAAQQHDKHEEFVASCMKDAGFDDEPAPYPDYEPPAEGDEPYYYGHTLYVPELPDSEAETARVGYGVMTWDEFGGGPTDEELAEAPEDARKIEEYLGSLTDSGREAYHRALTGGTGEASQGPIPDEEHAASCSGRAEAAFPRPSGESLAFLDPLHPMLEFFSELIGASEAENLEAFPNSIHFDPGVLALKEEYAACVLESPLAGEFAAPPDGPPSLFGLAMDTAPDGSRSDGEDPADAPEHFSLVGSEVEREIALVDFRCRGRTDYVGRYAGILRDREAAYVAEHQAELDVMMATVEELSKG